DNKQELHWNKDLIDQDVTYNFTSNVTVVEGKGIYRAAIKFRGLDADINFNDSDDHHNLKQTTSRRLADRKVERFEKNITKRGAVPETTAKKGSQYPVGPILLGFFVFVVIGSSLFQIIRTATSGGGMA
ncbi:hypothetical protein KY285_025429, partial [Solanum tuberosum]